MRYLLIFLLFATAFSFAHPPSDITIEYNLTEKTLSLIVNHDVKGDNHYINYVEISLNGKAIIKQNSSKQFDSNVQKYVYLIPEMKENDKITILSRCNIFGNMKKEFILKSEN